MGTVESGERGTVGRNVLRWAMVRVVPGLLGVMWVGLGLWLRSGTGSGVMPWAIKYGGVVLWCWVVHACIRLVSPGMGVLRAAAWTAVLGVGAEAAQASGVSAWLSNQHGLLRLVFGAVFSWWDVAASMAAALAVIPIDAGMRRVERAWQPGPAE